MGPSLDKSYRGHWDNIINLHDAGIWILSCVTFILISPNISLSRIHTHTTLRWPSDVPGCCGSGFCMAMTVKWHPMELHVYRLHMLHFQHTETANRLLPCFSFSCLSVLCFVYSVWHTGDKNENIDISHASWPKKEKKKRHTYKCKSVHAWECWCEK